ncbi:MAG: LysR family transcriptional regulator [Sphingobium sp.]|nr:LysR family transcriptional regulator [Sphingobium sp.]
MAGMQLDDIALFVEVVRHGSFSEAGRRHGMPPNTVSRRIDQLEQALGVRLMQRSTRRLTLTDAGHDLVERCAVAVDSIQQASQDIIAGVETPSGLVRVAVAADFFDFYRMEWIAEFLEAHPLVRLDFVLSDSTVDLISDGIDVAIRGDETRNPNYVVRRIQNLTIGLVASPAYLAARGTPEALQDLAHHDCVTFSHARNPASWRLRGPDGAETEVAVKGRFMANTAQALRKATLEGLGIALMPVMVAADIASGHLVRVLPDYQRSNLGLNIVYPSRRHLPRAVSAFIDSAVDKMRTGLFAAGQLTEAHGPILKD